MDAMEDLERGLELVGELLEHESLEPDPERGDWSEHAALVTALRDGFRDRVMKPFERVQRELDDKELIDRARMAVCNTGAPVIAIVYASGAREDAERLIAELRAVSAADWQDELDAGRRDMRSFVLLMYGRWLVAAKELDKARAVLDRVIDSSREPALAQEARAARIRSKPLTRGPTLFRMNGFGVGLYGARDRAGDTYVSTHCISALWIPVMPLSAYRVVNAGGGSYGFISREPLSPFAIWYRRLAPLAIVLLIAGWQVERYLTGPGRLAEQALVHARAAEAAGDIDTAIERYEAVAREEGYQEAGDQLAETGQALARLYLARIPEPFTMAHVEPVARALRRFESLPETARAPAASRAIADQVLAWSASLGDGDRDIIQARLRLLDAASTIAGTDTTAKQFTSEHVRIALRLGQLIESDWPLAALDIYIQDLTRNPDAARAAARVLDGLGERYALLHAAQPALDRWLAYWGTDSDMQDTVAAVRARSHALQARLDDPARKAALTAGDNKMLAAWLEKNPWDQEATAILAGNRAAAGDPAAAIEMLAAHGAPGWLTPRAVELLVSLYTETGRLDDAQATLGQQISFRLPRMLAASRAYYSTVEARRSMLIQRAQSGYLPRELEQRLQGKSEAEQQQLFGEWLREQLDSDPSLQSLRDTYVRYVDVVPMTVTLGMLKLERANQSTGQARDDLLDEAEAVLLSVSQDAEGLPEYHLGLGQVYHRLGKGERGEEEFRKLLARDEPALSLAVAGAYRGLGLVSRAKDVAEGVWKAGQAPYHHEAAHLLGIMMESDLDAAETWFQRADQSAPQVRIGLRQIQAMRLARDGELERADQVMGEVAAFYAANAAHSPAAANNAAVAYLARFQYTGDKRHLLSAKSSFEAALRLQADDAITLGNTADLYESLGMVEVLEHWVRVELVRPDTHAIRSILFTMLDGPLRDQVLERVRRNPALRRSRELTAQRIILAPKNTGGYESAATGHWLTGDRDKLRALRDTVAAQDRFDTQASDQMRARFQAGELDEELFEGIDSGLERLRKRAGAVAKHAPSHAVLQLMLGDLLLRRGKLRNDVSDFREAVAALRKADALWPDLGAKRILAAALSGVAILDAARTSTALAEQWDSERRIYDRDHILHRTLASASSGEILPVLRQSPELDEAVSLLLEPARRHAKVSDWILGKVAGNEMLEQLGKQAFTREEDLLRTDIDAMLAPNDADEQYRRALQQEHR